MSRPKVKWKQALRYFKRHGYEIRTSGGDHIILAPKTEPCKRRSRAPVRIGHNTCNHAKGELADVQLLKIKRAFGVTRDDLLGK